MFRFLLCVTFFAIANYGFAQKQISFDIQQKPDRFTYAYVWSDLDGNVFTTNFAFHPKDVEQGFHEIQPADLSGRYSDAIINSVGAKYGVELQQKPGISGVRIIYSQEKENLVDKIFKELDDLRAKELKSSFYNVRMDGNNRIIDLDYEAIVNRYKAAGVVIVNSLKPSLPADPRGKVARSLAFIQSIPYYTKFYNDANFQTPIGMFTENKGDCDTKSVCLTTILYDLGFNSILLLTDNHMLMGAAIPKQKSDVSISLNGVTYVLLEPTGGGFRLGQVAPSSMDQLTAQKYTIIGPF